MLVLMRMVSKDSNNSKVLHFFVLKWESDFSHQPTKHLRMTIPHIVGEGSSLQNSLWDQIVFQLFCILYTQRSNYQSIQGSERTWTKLPSGRNRLQVKLFTWELFVWGAAWALMPANPVTEPRRVGITYMRAINLQVEFAGAPHIV